MFIFLLFLVLIISIGSYAFLSTAPFGKLPSGERLKRVQQSANFKNGSFQNLSHTPDIAEDANYFSVMWEFLFKKSKDNTPTDTIPSVKTNLKSLPIAQPLLIWMGHSSYLLQIHGKKILVDPVLGGSASPIPGSVKSFAGTDAFSLEDLPEIDYLFISHDHWDHLDYPTMQYLKDKVKKVVTGLGTGEHLEYWGFDKSIIWEGDWGDQLKLDDSIQVILQPARHFSGRGLQRNQALWVSFVVLSPQHRLYLGGDSGYDSHFKEIGKNYGPFDMAILECGQYNKSWKYIHMMPEEVVEAALDLNAKKLLPVHFGKFSLANHSWYEPIQRVKTASQNRIELAHPRIGDPLWLDSSQTFTEWWQ